MAQQPGGGGSSAKPDPEVKGSLRSRSPSPWPRRRRRSSVRRGKWQQPAVMSGPRRWGRTGGGRVRQLKCVVWQACILVEPEYQPPLNLGTSVPLELTSSYKTQGETCPLYKT